MKSEDTKTIKDNNLTESEVEYFIERMGFRVEDGGMEENKAKVLTLKEIGELRRKNGRIKTTKN